MPEEPPTLAPHTTYVVQAHPAGPAPQATDKKDIIPAERWELHELSLFRMCNVILPRKIPKTWKRVAHLQKEISNSDPQDCLPAQGEGSALKSANNISHWDRAPAEPGFLHRGSGRGWGCSHHISFPQPITVGYLPAGKLQSHTGG